jgi:5S rRNA maturation endonuclease (ribonuclease M5)
VSGYETVVEAIEGYGLFSGWTSGTTRSARCPAHDDSVASLSVSEGDEGKALLYCHAGCSTAEVCEALDLHVADLFSERRDSTVAAVYEYLDESNRPLYRVLRLEPKGFSQERWEDGEWKPGMRDVRRVLYHLPELLRLGDETVYIVEGEKDADNLMRDGAFATSLVGGAGKWRDEYLEFFTDREVVIIPDQDDAGLKHAALLVEKLTGTAASVTIRHPAVGKDVTNHLLAGLTLDELKDEANEVAVFEPWDPDTYEVRDEEWLFEPYIPRGGRVLVFGASGSLKSLWASWVGAHVAAEGGKVAYFSLEMRKNQYAKRWRQLQHIGFPKANYSTFGRFMFGMNLTTAIKAFEGYDLLIIDSWSQAQNSMGGNDNDAISMMDADFFQPLIDATGATLLIIDNTGKDGSDAMGKKVANEEARGASRKKDIQEVAWFLRRPDENDNFTTRISCRKMRLDVPMPQPVTIFTPRDRIEFYKLVGEGKEEPMWPGMVVDPSHHVTVPGAASIDTPQDSPAMYTSTSLPVPEVSTPPTSQDGSAGSPPSSTSAQPYVDPASLTGLDKIRFMRAQAKLQGRR